MGRQASAISQRYVDSGVSSFLNVRLQLARIEVADGDRLDRILTRAAQLSCEQLDVARVGIWFFDPHHTTLTQVVLHTRGSPTSEPEPTETKLAVSEIPKYLAALESKRVLAIEDVLTSELATELLPGYVADVGIRSLLDAPIFRKGQIMGVVCHEHAGEPRVFTPRELDFAASVADMIALYLEEAEAATARQMLLSQEKELLVAERYASLGVVAGYIAHDLNNAVAPILLCAQQLRTMFRGNADANERIEIILKAAEHGAGLARRLLVKATSATPVRDPISVDTVLADATPLLRGVAGDASLQVRLGAGDAFVALDPLELVRAIINLITNARDACLGRAGVITLTTSAPAGRFMLSLSDNGVGMSDEVQARLFQPFFTTKPGRGSGLGLASIKNMIEAVSGTIDVKSSIGEGTVVSLSLPLAADGDGAREAG